jgi:hypothetical protein
MKKLLLSLSLTLLLGSCDSDEQNPRPLPDPAVLAKHQAPFSSKPVDIKLKELMYNGRLIAEYIYEGDLLSQQKKFLTFMVPGHYQTGSFKRNGGLTESYEVISADWVGESEYVSDVFKPTYALTFKAPLSDSLVSVTEENLTFLDTYYRIYVFDKEGFIKREEFSEGPGNSGTDFKILYQRDAQHNILKSDMRYTARPDILQEVTYQYDNHPNPFFKLGIDRSGQLSIHSLSPNNIVKETFKPDNEPAFSVNYMYEYLPNGYPSKVTVKSESPTSQTYTIDFVY